MHRYQNLDQCQSYSRAALRVFADLGIALFLSKRYRGNRRHPKHRSNGTELWTPQATVCN